MAAPRRLPRTSTVDALAGELRREILDGELAAGSWLRERELCEAYGVARHSLRAALRALAADGLVRIEAACAGDDPPWSAINEAHAGMHAAIVEAARSPRIAAAHAALSGEMRLFLLALRPHVPARRLAADHAALVRDLEREGPAVLRVHLRAAAATLVNA